jgi:uncharacterized repeat protein (TIGR04076 family)
MDILVYLGCDGEDYPKHQPIFKGGRTMPKKYKITLEITNVGGICMSGCKVGQKFDLSDNRTDNLCGTFYHSLFPTISVFDYDGDLWFLSDKNKLEVRCPDYVNDVRGILKREYVGELKLPPEVLKKMEELKKQKAGTS